MQLFDVGRTLMFILEKTLSNRNENGKFEISNPDLPKLKRKKSTRECFTVNSTLLYFN